MGEGWSQSQVRYYIYGFLFVIFDVESVFLFPWARVFEALGYTAVVEMAIFIGILARGAAVRVAQGGAEVGLITEQTPIAKIQPVKFILNWGRRYSLWVMNFGLACCAIELIATSTSKHDFIRLGVIPFAHGPRQADLLVVAGTLTDKMAPAIKRVYDQMPDPEVRDLVRVVLQLRRTLLGLLLRDEGRRPDHPRRRLRPGLPSAARGAPARHHPAAGEDQGRKHRGEVPEPGRPHLLSPDESGSRLRARFGDDIVDVVEQHGHAVADGHGRSVPRRLSGSCRDEPEFACDYCDFTGGVDFGPEGGFEVVTHLFSTTHHHNVRVKVKLPARGPGLSRRSPTSTRRRTGTSARRSRCSGSRSRATRSR